MLSCSLLFSDPFFLLNTLHYSLIFRFVKQFFKKYYVFSLKIVKIYFLTQKTRIFIIEEKAQNQKASAERWYFCMGYYDKERVRGFLHNQDGIIVNDFGEEVILRGWGMGNWDNPEGFMLGTQSGFGLFEPGKYAPMGRMDRGRSMDQILRETCGTKYAEEFWKRWRRLYLTEEDIALLSRRGYNSVRLPIRAGSFLYEEPGITYNEDSFAMLNDVLDWCETYQVYAVVDFHAATAGQSGIPCDDGVDNGQHLYDDEESMERMFLLMEEFMRRYKDRWIIGAYDCINEPISMTPRREELTPKLVYFYEEMIRRCRKIDQKHLFLLNGTQFSSLTYFFDHEFDPEYHNWGISLHAYEMVVPEVASLASVLRTCREQKICLWMGETGGRNEHAWQTTMYEILAEYHAGYNLWCWKTVEGAGCASILNFNVPDEWHLITDYAINGAAKPSYEHAQAIWDSYLECLAVDKCKENTQYHPYLLREGNFEIPAIGYNALPMDSHRGLSDLPNATGYRLYDRFELVYEKGYHPEPAGFAAPGPIKHPRDHVQLQLGTGEYASYTIREKETYTVSVTYCADKEVKVQAAIQGETLFEGVMPPAGEKVTSDVHPYFAYETAPNTLERFTLGTVTGEGILKIEVLDGCARFGQIVIRKSGK